MSHISASRPFGRLWISGPTKCSLAFLSIAALAGGCNSSTDIADTAVQTQNNRPAASSITPLVLEGHSGVSHSPLVGAWMGKAIINEQALLATADSLPGDQRQALIHEARSFVTTEMAIQFSPSGEIETAIEMQPVGSEKIAGETIGTWKIIEATGTRLIVETSSTDATGVSATNRTAFAVSIDGDRLVLQPQVSPALAGCEALIYLDRQVIPAAANVARMPEANPLR